MKLRETMHRLTGSRHRIDSDTSSSRVHIAHNRVAQPLTYGDPAVSDPLIQTSALRFIMACKFRNPNPQLTWVQILEEQLRERRLSSLCKHGFLGYHEWRATALVMDSQFWSKVFHTIADLIALSHEHDRSWHLILITGYEQNEFDAGQDNHRENLKVSQENLVVNPAHLS